MTNYAPADRRAQWFADAYPGARITPNCGVLHTTETMGWPGYGDGATAPGYTTLPDIARRILLWRAHFPDEMSSRALRNEAGGVNTNTANAVQVELIGTCDHSKRHEWRVNGRTYRAGVDYIYWPEAPLWALEGLAHFIADMHRRHGIRIQGPKEWIAYGPDPRVPGRLPASYGAHPYRMSFAAWRGFYGWCGHQHVPENSHGDPGALDWQAVEDMARALVEDKPTPPATPTPVPSWRHRVVTQNLNWAKPGTHEGILGPLMLRPRVGVIFVQEAKRTPLTGIVAKHPGWRLHWDRSFTARANTALIVRESVGEFVEDGVTVVTPAAPGILTRYAAWAVYRLPGDPREVIFLSVHLPPGRLRRLWPLGDAALRGVVDRQRALGRRVVMGGDWNRPNVLFGRGLGMRVGNVGIDGFLTTADVALSRVKRLPGNASDHDPVAAWIEAAK